MLLSSCPDLPFHEVVLWVIKQTKLAAAVGVGAGPVALAGLVAGAVSIAMQATQITQGNAKTGNAREEIGLIVLLIRLLPQLGIPLDSRQGDLCGRQQTDSGSIYSHA
ncbi:unnamed protein product [Calypogeia fissa]